MEILWNRFSLNRRSRNNPRERGGLVQPNSLLITNPSLSGRSQSREEESPTTERAPSDKICSPCSVNPLYSDFEEVESDEVDNIAEQSVDKCLLQMNAQELQDANNLVQLVDSYLLKENVEKARLIRIAIQLIEMCLQNANMGNELYDELMKKTKRASHPEWKQRIWELWLIIASKVPPSEAYRASVLEYVDQVLRDENNSADLREIVGQVQKGVQTIKQSRDGHNGVTFEEIETLLSNRMQDCVTVKFLDGDKHTLHYEKITTVEEAIQIVAQRIKLVNYSSFALYEVSWKKDLETCALEEQHLCLDSHSYIADVISQHNSEDEAKGPYHLLFKRRLFRNSDNNIIDPICVSLSYLQVQHDYLAGHYSNSEEKAAQLCALQIIVAEGGNLQPDDPQFNQAAVRFAAHNIYVLHEESDHYQDIHCQYAKLTKLSKAEGKQQFLHTTHGLPYGHSTFCLATKTEDPTGLFPADVLLGISAQGMQFLEPSNKERILATELTEITDFGTSNSILFLKINMSGVEHEFKFHTVQANEICFCLHAYQKDVLLMGHEISPQELDWEDTYVEEVEGEGEDSCLGQECEQCALETKQHEILIEQYKKSIEEKKCAFVDSTRELSIIMERFNLVKKDNDDIQACLLEMEKQIIALNRELSSLRESITATEASGTIETTQDQRTGELEIGLRNKEEILAAKAKCRAFEEELSKRLDRKKQVVDQLAKLATLESSDVEEMRAELEELDEMLTDEAHCAKIQELERDLEDSRALYKATQQDLAHLRQMQAERKESISHRSISEMSRSEVDHHIENTKSRIRHLKKQCMWETAVRKRCYNQIQDLKGKVRVYCRVRPLLPFDKKKSEGVGVRVRDTRTLEVRQKQKKKNRQYTFDHVFSEDASQEEIFSSSRDLIQSVVDGINVCVFAYGQTGSGKTHTICGTPSDQGLAHRSIKELFRILEQGQEKFSFSVKCYMLEMYRETIIDLLAPASCPSRRFTEADIRKGPDNMMYVHETTMKTVRSERDLKELMARAQKRRQVCSVFTNHESSRSHLVMSFIVETKNLMTQDSTAGKLSLIDLTGSENVKSFEGPCKRLKEAQATNKSLSALGDVISALAEETNYVPYRNHKLTRLMSDTVGINNGKTVMFVNIAPSNYDLGETQNSLHFITRIKALKKDASKVRMAKEHARLKEQLSQWAEKPSKLSLLEEYYH